MGCPSVLVRPAPARLVVLRLVSSDDLKSGLLGTIGLSYLAVLALLSPVSILGHVLHLPVAVLSWTCALVFLAAVVHIARRRWWREIGRLVLTGLGVELLLIGADLVIGARVGAFMPGDAKVHIARIRMMLEHGLSNIDPYVSPDYFFPIYHTNILHGLHAACVQLTGADVLDEWFINVIWAKLVVVGGCYFMGYALFESRWVAGLTALFVLAQHAPVTYLIYPNALAAWWLLPIMIGFAAQACRTPCDWRTPLKLAAGSLVLGQVHALYAVFAGVGLAPFLGGLALVRLARRRPDYRRLAACVLALGVAAPFVLVGKAKMARDSDVSDAEVATDKQFHQLANGQSVYKPSSGMELGLLAAGILCAAAGARRKPAAVVIVGAALAAAVLFIPAFCTAAIAASRQPHTVARMNVLIMLASVALMPGAVAFLLEPSFRSRWLRALGSILIFVLGAQTARQEPYTWPTYWKSAAADSAVRHGWLTRLRNSRAFFREHIPRGATVLTDVQTAMWLVMTHDCHVVVPQRGSYGVTDLRQREADLQALLAPATPWEVRRGLLAKYDISLVLVSGSTREPLEWTRDHVQEYWKEGGYLLIRLKAD
ncbi:MAG: hypothetical protein V2A79_01145 [Planctomycetota bacterium]